MNCTILQGDALELLRTLPPESVHTCVTSPPYYPIRLRTSKRGEVAGMRNMGCSWACPAGKSWACGTEQRRREKPLIRSSHDRSRSGNDRTGRTSCIACG